MFEELVKKKRRTGPSLKMITATVLFGAIILVFVFWGFNPRGNAVAEGGAAAVVNGAMISQLDVNEQVENLRRNPFFAQFGGQDKTFLQAQAVNTLINSELIAQKAESEGILVTDGQIRDTIVNEPYFQENGHFRRDRYLGYLQATRKSASEFESQQRKEQTRQRTIRLVQMGLAPTDLEIKKQVAMREIKANAEFVAISTAEAVKPSTLAAGDIATYLKSSEGQKRAKEYYDLHQAEFVAAVAHDKAKPADDKKEEKPVAQPFEKVQDQIARKLLAEEKSGKAVDEVRELVKKGDMAAVNQWIQSHGYKWDETGTFDIETPAIPKIGQNPEFADAAFSLSSSKPLLDKLIRQGTNTYIVRYKAPAATAKKSAEDEMKPDQIKESIAGSRTQDAFSRWVKDLRETASIRVSETFGKGAVESEPLTE